MSSGPKKGTQIYFFFSLKTSWQPNALQVLQCGPCRERYLLTGHFYISLENLIKIPLNKKALRKEHPSKFPKSGAPVEADAHF